MDNQYEQYIGKRKEPSAFSKIVDPAASAIGAAAGMLLAGPAGAAAGYQIGHSVGNTAEQAANGQLTPEAVQAGATGTMSGWKAMSPLFFATGGMVPTGPAWDDLQQALERSRMPVQPQTPPDMSQMPGLLEQAAGKAPTPPTMQTASHPNLEMLATVIPQVLAAMPKPANPKNTRAVGAWLPAAGAAMSAPLGYVKGKRDKANAAAQDAYDTQVDARNKIMAGAAPAIAGALTRGQASSKPSAYDEIPMDEKQAVTITGDRQWTGRTLKDYNTYLDRIRAFKTSGSGSAAGGAMEGDNLPGGPETLTDDALRQQAIYFAVSGQLMNTGGRDKITAQQSRRIMNESARLFPGRSLAQARAAYAGNTKSRTEMQTGRDGIEAFASSAAKNLSMMKGILAKLPESGSPVLNWGWRKFEDKMAGSPDMAAFHALRMSLNAEYSRLTQSMKLTGTGIPVSAQQEIRDAISPNATVGQILHAYRVLYLESANRAQVMNDMLREIDSRFQLAPETPVAPTRVGKIEDSEYSGSNPRRSQPNGR